MLNAKNVTARIAKHEILHGVNFTVPPQEISVLLGKNGSGKSTLLRTVCGDIPYGGSLRLCDTEIADISPRVRAKCVALLPQILPETPLSVRELVCLGRTPYIGGMGILSEEDKTVVARAMEEAGVSAFAARAVCTLSGGERQRAFLAMMLAQEAELLAMDEPTTYMDAAARGQLFAICRALCAAGKTLLLTMHDINEALSLGTHFMLLEAGRVVFEGTKDALLATALLESTFGTARHTTTDGATVFF